MAPIAADGVVPGEWKVRIYPDAIDIHALEFETDDDIIFRVEMAFPGWGFDRTYSAYDESLKSDVPGVSDRYWLVSSAMPPRYCIYRMKEIGVFLSKPLEPGPIVMLFEVPSHEEWHTRMVVGEGRPVPGGLLKDLVAMRMDLASLVYGHRVAYWDGWIGVSDLRAAIEKHDDEEE